MTRLALALGTLLLLAGCGDKPDPTNSAEYRTQAKELAKTQSDLKTTQSDLAQAKEDILTVQGELPDREKKVESAKASLQKALDALDDQESSIKAEAADLKKRERKFNALVGRAQDNAVSDGVYEVGTDMTPGTYRTPDAGSSCYWQLSSDPNGDNILSNDLPTGPAIVAVSSGEFFTSKQCGTWLLQ